MSKNIHKLFNEEIKVINIGLPSFADELKKQGVTVLSLDWKPPTISPKVQALLERIKKTQHDQR